MAFYQYNGSKCTEDKDAIQNIFPLSGNWKYICKGNHFLCQNVPNAKDLKEMGTLEIHIIREKKKRKISVPCFRRKFEVGKK